MVSFHSPVPLNPLTSFGLVSRRHAHLFLALLLILFIRRSRSWSIVNAMSEPVSLVSLTFLLPPAAR